MTRGMLNRTKPGIAIACMGVLALSGCYTELTHPDYDTEHVEYTDSDAECTRCHVHGHSWGTNSYYRWGYGWMSSPWLYDPVYRYYYGDPWWWEPPPPSDPGPGTDFPATGSLGDRGSPGRRGGPPGSDPNVGSDSGAPIPITGPVDVTADDTGTEKPRSVERRDKAQKDDVGRKTKRKMKAVGRPEKKSNSGGADRQAPSRRHKDTDEADRG